MEDRSQKTGIVPVSRAHRRIWICGTPFMVSTSEYSSKSCRDMLSSSTLVAQTRDVKNSFSLWCCLCLVFCGMTCGWAGGAITDFHGASKRFQQGLEVKILGKV